jgi:hypothetical protein
MDDGSTVEGRAGDHLLIDPGHVAEVVHAPEKRQPAALTVLPTPIHGVEAVEPVG